MIHRDIKLDNVLLSKPIDDPQELNSDIVKVTDFGISVPFTPGQVSRRELECEKDGYVIMLTPSLST